MESVGQCFGLPIESSDIIGMATKLYKTWLLELDMQPKPIKNDPQPFYKVKKKYFM